MRFNVAFRAAALFALFFALLTWSVAAPAHSQQTRTERLLHKHLDPFVTDENGWSHLHWAALANDAESVRLLMELGAYHSPSADSDGDAFSLYGRRRARLVGVKDEFWDDWSNSGDTPLHIAAWLGKSDAAAALVEGGADIHAADRLGATPLHNAAFANSRPIVIMLLDKGANINVQDLSGATPTDWAVGARHAGLQSFLEEKGGYCNKYC